MLSLAASAAWKRALLDPGLHPFQTNLGASAIFTVRSEQNAEAGGPVTAASVPRYDATAIRSSRLMVKAMDIIAPESSARKIRADGIFCRASRCGMRGLVCSWQPEQRFWYTTSPEVAASIVHGRKASSPIRQA